MVKFLCLMGVLVGCWGCAESIGAPSAALETPRLITYAINVPERMTAQTLITRYPDGVRMSPIWAQLTWDFRDAYQGTPNVYYGPLAPPIGDPYILTGIVIAPAQVAGQTTFTAREWPDEYGRPFQDAPAHTVFAWVGRFVYTPAGPRSILGK